MAGTTLSRLVILLVFFHTVSSVPYNIEAEGFAQTLRIFEDRMRDRTNANMDKSLWVKKGEVLSMRFCLDVESEVSIKNIYWSNDGWVDAVSVILDGKDVGSFTTNDASDWGNLWNKIHSTGPIGEVTSLTSGQHVIALRIKEADFYGLEIDRVELDVVGDDNGVHCPMVKKFDNGNCLF